jgi:hypothetical protein
MTLRRRRVELMEDRYFVVDAFPGNLGVMEALGHFVVGIGDEKAGGLVAYANPQTAEEIVQAMNAKERLDA